MRSEAFRPLIELQTLLTLGFPSNERPLTLIIFPHVHQDISQRDIHYSHHLLQRRLSSLTVAVTRFHPAKVRMGLS